MKLICDKCGSECIYTDENTFELFRRDSTFYVYCEECKQFYEIHIEVKKHYEGIIIAPF